ncbi:MAG: riboflavin biosynthesis protein RibF, partial [Odoribacter sp.]|nr:riboflavin biosynthesis protein RibF [Odoribacter sp.]
MKIYKGLSELNIKNPVVTIGSFDGVHLGHQQVIKALKKYAQETNTETAIITFDPHPREVLYPLEKAPGILTTLEEKIDLLTSYEIDNLIILEFTPELAASSYEEFVKLILVDKLHISGLVIGYDHRFGKNREGDFSALNLLGQKYNFSIVQQKVYTTNEINVSSTKIRTGLETGDIEYVNGLLDYKYFFSGIVAHGDKIGREIGFPTANIQLNDERKMLPAPGVYAVEVKLDNILY